jgi:membrane protease YdiL (CAAX protease family)
MAMSVFTLLSAVAAAAGLTAALPSPGQPGSHEPYALAVKSAGDQALKSALARYDAALARAPSDAVAAVERCKLIGATMDDSDEGDTERGELFNACVAMLEQRFPHAAVAALYRLELKWGEAAVAFGQAILADPQLRWTDAERAQVYRKLSQQYSDKQLALASGYARQAVDLDPSLDLTRVLGAQLLAEGRRAEAIVTLSSRPDGPGFDLVQKAKLLANAGAFDRALWLIDHAKRQSDAYIDPVAYGSILERAGRVDEARAQYAAQKGVWNRQRVLTRLFLIDLERGTPSSATESYRALRGLGWRADPLGRYRLALARKAPAAQWQRRDLAGLAALLACVVALMLLPALWVVPVHYWSLWRRLRGPPAPPPTMATRWGFRHLWLASAAFLVTEVGAMYVFDYDDLAFWIPAAQKQAPSTHAVAACGLWAEVALIVALAALLLRRRDLSLFGAGAWPLGRSVGRAAAALGIVLGIGLVMLLMAKLLPAALTLAAILAAIRQVYGVAALVLVVVVIAPLTEELVFRSVLLDLLGGYLPFFWANAIQSLLFAAAHMELRRLPYLFALGFLSGRLRRGSGGLFASVLLHAGNNALFVVLMLATSQRAVVARRPVQRPAAPELVECVRAAGDGPARALAARMAPPAALMPVDFNNLAWSLAIDPRTSPACLRRAEAAVGEALKAMPDDPHFLDTKATVLAREGRLDEAIDLERMVVDRVDNPVTSSQLDRFLRQRNAKSGAVTIGGGAAATVRIAHAADAHSPAKSQQAIVVELGDGFKDGLTLYAHVLGAHGELGLLRASFGRDHARSYHLVSDSGPMNLPEDTRFEVALVDARGCGGCAADAWQWRLTAHDPSVDAYP